MPREQSRVSWNIKYTAWRLPASKIQRQTCPHQEACQGAGTFSWFIAAAAATTDLSENH